MSTGCPSRSSSKLSWGSFSVISKKLATARSRSSGLLRRRTDGRAGNPLRCNLRRLESWQSAVRAHFIRALRLGHLDPGRTPIRLKDEISVKRFSSFGRLSSSQLRPRRTTMTLVCFFRSGRVDRQSSSRDWYRRIIAELCSSSEFSPSEKKKPLYIPGWKMSRNVRETKMHCSSCFGSEKPT